MTGKLPGGRVIRDRLYVLTASGQLWGWGGGTNCSFLGIYPDNNAADADEAFVLHNPTWIRDTRVDEDGTKKLLPTFVMISVNAGSNTTTLCAVDTTGRVYGCGRGFIYGGTFDDPGFSYHGSLVPLPHTPAPVRDILALHSEYHSGYGYLHSFEDGESGVIEGWLDNLNSRSIGPLALLNDGTLFSLLRQDRLPMCEDVIQADAVGPNCVRLMKADGTEIHVNPIAFFDIYNFAT